MKKIALINLKYKIDIAFERKESLALGYLAGVLIENGHAVDLIDAQYFDLSVEAVYQQISKKTYDVIGFSLYQETVESFDKLYNLLRQNRNNPFMCFGGHFSTFTAEKLLIKYPEINAVVIGEGEITFAELVENSLSSEWKKVNGICYIEDGILKYTEPRKLIEDLNLLPFPIRYADYSTSVEFKSGSAIISASRGCYANCAFCSIQSFYRKLKGKKIRVRAPRNVVDEIECLYTKFGVKNFFFADDNFLTVNRIQNGWLSAFVDDIKNRRLNISFDMDCRVNDIDVDLFKKLKSIGLNGVFLGIESFNQRMLDTLGKNVTVHQNIDAITILKKMRFNVWMGFIMFDMFTTLDEIKHNINVLDQLKYFKYFNYDRPLSSDWLSSILQLYNGTPILKFMRKEHSELLVENNRLGYDFLFKHKATERFYLWLLKWKPIVKEMIQLDTLQLVRIANQKGNQKVSAELHKLSREYLQIDRNTFNEILNAVDVSNEALIENIIDKGKAALVKIKNQIIFIRDTLGF